MTQACRLQSIQIKRGADIQKTVIHIVPIIHAQNARMQVGMTTIIATINIYILLTKTGSKQRPSIAKVTRLTHDKIFNAR